MIKAIFFDLDGTLLDTLEDLADSVNHVLTKHSMQNRTLDEIRSFIGNGIPTLIARSVPAGTDAELLKKCVDEMQAYYKEHSDIKTCPYKDIDFVLEVLNTIQIPCVVVTNKAEESAKILCENKFAGRISLVIGDNGTDRLKPAPDNVFRALETLKLKKEEILYVGDSDVDIETAKNAGVTSIGVSWGFRDAELLKSKGADYIIDTPKGLLLLLEHKFSIFY